MSENNSGGLNDPGRSGTGSVGAGGVNSGSNNAGGSNYGSAYGGSTGTGGYNRPYGITPFNVPRRDQTLQDRQFGNLGGGMVGTSFGGSNGTGANLSNPVVQSGVVWNPVLKKYVPKPTPKPKFNPVTGQVVTPQPAPIVPQNFGFVNPQTGYTQPLDTSNIPLYQAPSPIVPVGTHPTVPGLPDLPHTDPYGTPGGGWPGTRNEAVPSGNVEGGNYPGGMGGVAGRQFGGPVAPGQQYTVGENGPETLQMGPGGGGQVIPHNPMDRLGGMRPEMMQQFHQLLQQWHQGRPQGGPGQQDAMQDWRGQRPERPQMGGPPMPPQQPQTYPPAPQQPPQQGGGWQNRMGIEGLSRPMRPPGGGFGLSGLGQPGVMGQLRNQFGQG